MYEPNAVNENEALTRRRLVSLAQAILGGSLSFLEGAIQVLAVKSQLRRVADRDQDFDVFLLIQSETDHLPLEEQRPLWAPEALERLKSEFNESEEWARSFAP